MNKFRFSQPILIKVPNIKFQENLSSGSGTDTHRQMDMIKPAGTLLNYANMTKNFLLATILEEKFLLEYCAPRTLSDIQKQLFL
jgi:hypothetical protein